MGSLPWASVTPADRLGAMLEAVVISDRWAAQRQDTLAAEDPGWQGKLLEAGAICGRGEGRSPALWRPALEGIVSPAAVALVTMPYLWQQADAYGHHRASLEGWIEELGVAPAARMACLGLYQVFCVGVADPDSGAAWGRSVAQSAGLGEFLGHTLESAIALVAQSQGQWTTALALADRRGRTGAALALVGLLVGWAGGRASLGASLRQQWLMAPQCCLQPSADDPWGGLEAVSLAKLTADLHGRWSGLGS